MPLHVKIKSEVHFDEEDTDVDEDEFIGFDENLVQVNENCD